MATGVAVLVVTLTSSLTATALQGECTDRLDVGRCPPIYNDRGAPVFRWFYDPDTEDCLAFTYYGCSRSRNRFKTRSDCWSRCGKLDGPVCILKGKPVEGLRTNSSDRTCGALRCPSGYRCKNAAFNQPSVCCPNRQETIYAKSHSRGGLCQRGSRPLREAGDTILGKSCSTLRCPHPYVCESNEIFANCCPPQTIKPRIKREKNNTTNTAISSSEDPLNSDSVNNNVTWVYSGKFQGDIAGFENQSEFDEFVDTLNTIALLQTEKRNNTDGRSRSAHSDPARWWPGGRVPYIISSRNQSLINAVHAAIEDIHAHTCVKFVQRTYQWDYINITGFRDRDCSSHLGRKKGMQEVSLGIGCRDKLTALHEFMHSLGFWHEHQRSDRDDHVIVLRDNILPGEYEDNFRKASHDEMFLIGHYDVNSIMHYPSSAFASDNKPTLRLKQSNKLIGKPVGLTAEDINKIKHLYNCDNATANSRCPSDTIDDYLADDGTKYPACAKLYDRTGCNGNWIKVNSGWESDDLSKIKMHGKSNWHWDDEFSSLELNPGCVAKLCEYKYLAGQCELFYGGKSGRNVRTLNGFEKQTSSLSCTCQQCSWRPKKTFVNDEVTLTMCGIIYDQTHCASSGNSLRFAPWESNDLREVRRGADSDWYDRVMSIEISHGAVITLCSFAGTCTDITTSLNYLQLDHPVASLRCALTAEADEIPVRGHRRGNTLPTYIPEGVQHAGRRFCALALQSFTDKSYGHWIPDKDRNLNRDQTIIYAFTYLVTGESCALYYCPKENFKGDCSILAPSMHSPKSGAGFFIVKSYKCNCST